MAHGGTTGRRRGDMRRRESGAAVARACDCALRARRQPRPQLVSTRSDSRGGARHAAPRRERAPPPPPSFGTHVRFRLLSFPSFVILRPPSSERSIHPPQPRRATPRGAASPSSRASNRLPPLFVRARSAGGPRQRIKTRGTDLGGRNDKQEAARAGQSGPTSVVEITRTRTRNKKQP